MGPTLSVCLRGGRAAGEKKGQEVGRMTATAVLGYAAWMLVLLLILATLRSYLTLSGRRAANSFRPDGADVSPFSERLCRAHANCYESFPILGGLMLLALATGRAAVTDPLASWVLLARVAQSTTHLISTSALAVQIRFFFFLVQFAIALWWVIALASS
jgi:uncharacterized MAPEG superfamily protein